MIIMKFGGTSVGSADAIHRVRDIVISRKSHRPVVVVSALSGVTNLLVALVGGEMNQEEIIQKHGEVITELWQKPPQALVEYVENAVSQTIERSSSLPSEERSDALLSLGEQLSSRIVSEYISEIAPARQYNATEFLVTNDHFGAAEIMGKETRRGVQVFKSQLGGVIPVITGFIGATIDGRTTTLGRGSFY